MSACAVRQWPWNASTVIPGFRLMIAITLTMSLAPLARISAPAPARPGRSPPSRRRRVASGGPGARDAGQDRRDEVPGADAREAGGFQVAHALGDGMGEAGAAVDGFG